MRPYQIISWIVSDLCANTSDDSERSLSPPWRGGGGRWGMHRKSVADSLMNSTHRSQRRAAGITIKPLALFLDRTWNAECRMQKSGRLQVWRHDTRRKSCVSITPRIEQNLSVAIKFYFLFNFITNDLIFDSIFIVYKLYICIFFKATNLL